MRRTYLNCNNRTTFRYLEIFGTFDDAVDEWLVRLRPVGGVGS